jgi:hypothetical protein
MVAVEYQQLEALINTVIWVLSEIYEKDAASPMTTSLNLQKWLDILRVLFSISSDDKPSRTTEAGRELRRLRRQPPSRRAVAAHMTVDKRR